LKHLCSTRHNTERKRKKRINGSRPNKTGEEEGGKAKTERRGEKKGRGELI